MRRKLLLVFLLGAWCGGTVFMWFVATQNFRVVETILAGGHAEFRETAAALDAENLRLIMRYQASEVNRLFFEGWGLVQVPVAAVVLFVAWKQEGKFVFAAAATMLVICLVLQFYVVPETVRLGRIIDFLPREPAPPEAAPFWRLHHTYTTLDMLKFLLALACVGSVLRKN